MFDKIVKIHFIIHFNGITFFRVKIFTQLFRLCMTQLKYNYNLMVFSFQGRVIWVQSQECTCFLCWRRFDMILHNWERTYLFKCFPFGVDPSQRKIVGLETQRSNFLIIPDCFNLFHGGTFEGCKIYFVFLYDLALRDGFHVAFLQ